MGGDRRTKRRGIALGVALAVHVAVLWFALYIEALDRRHASPEAEPVMTMSISLPATPPPLPVQPVPPRNTPRTTAPPPVPVPQVTTPDESSTAITLPPNTPFIDWNREAEISARSVVTPGEAPRQRSLDGEVKGMDLPEDTVTHKRGDSSISWDGTIGVYATDGLGPNKTAVYCESKPPLLMDHFETWSRFVPVKCGARRVGRPPPALDLDRRDND